MTTENATDEHSGWPSVDLVIYAGNPKRTFTKRAAMPVLPVGSLVYFWMDGEGEPSGIRCWNFDVERGTVQCILDDEFDAELVGDLRASGFDS